jgi:hypothetical protein
MRAETFALIKQALHDGVVCCYGRGLRRTYLRIRYRYNAREDDVRDTIAALDIPATESHRKGPDKAREGGEFITPGPDWPWCCDGQGKEVLLADAQFSLYILHRKPTGVADASEDQGGALDQVRDQGRASPYRHPRDSQALQIWCSHLRPDLRRKEEWYHSHSSSSSALTMRDCAGLRRYYTHD